MFAEGCGVVQNEEEAVKWFYKAAEQGHAVAQFNLGGAYATGRGITKSNGDAVKWYRRAAKQGNGDAQNNLGVMYYEGRGVPQSYTEAVKWFREAAEQEQAAAQCNLGMMYLHGLGVLLNHSVAKMWLCKAAKQGNMRARRHLNAVTWAHEVAERGNAVTQLVFAKMREPDHGVAKTAKWHCVATEVGEAELQYNIGLMYCEGRGVAKDEAKAIRQFRKAAELGHMAARLKIRGFALEGKASHGMMSRL